MGLNLNHHKTGCSPSFHLEFTRVPFWVHIFDPQPCQIMRLTLQVCNQALKSDPIHTKSIPRKCWSPNDVMDPQINSPLNSGIPITTLLFCRSRGHSFCNYPAKRPFLTPRPPLSVATTRWCATKSCRIACPPLDVPTQNSKLVARKIRREGGLLEKQMALVNGINPI